MALDPTATDAQGALSQGDNSNTAFAEPAYPGHTAWADITPPDGEQYPDFTLLGIEGCQLSLVEGGPWEDVGAPLSVGDWFATVRVHFRVDPDLAEPVNHPRLVVPVNGYVALSAEGGAGSVAGAAGSVTIPASEAGGGAGSQAGAAGSVSEVEGAEGGAGVAAGASGVASVPGRVEGGAGSEAGAAGTVAEVASVQPPQSVDSYTETPNGDLYLGGAADNRAGQSFLGNGLPIHSARFILAKVGNPPADGAAVLYAATGASGQHVPTGAPLATSALIARSALPETPDWVEFIFTDGPVLADGTRYVIAYELVGALGDAANKVIARTDNAIRTHDGNLSLWSQAEGWAASVWNDLPFKVYGATASGAGSAAGAVGDVSEAGIASVAGGAGSQAGAGGAAVEIAPVGGAAGSEAGAVGEAAVGVSYKTVNITGQAGAGTGYQIRLVIAKGTDDGSSDFGLDSQVANWPYDIEFRAADGVTVYPYWREASDASYVTVWVKVAADLSTNQSMLCVYGDGGADTSDIDDTFIFGDAFPAALDTVNKWTVAQGSIEVSGGELQVVGTTGTRGRIHGKSAFGAPVGSAIRAKVRSIGSTADNIAGNWICVLSTPEALTDYCGMNGGTNANRVNGVALNSGSSESDVDLTVSDLSTGVVLETCWSAAAVYYKEISPVVRALGDCTDVADIPNEATMTPFFYEGATANCSAAVDWVIVRKWQATEPAFASVS